MAVISFDFSSHIAWASVSPLSLAQAVTRCSIFLPDFFANERRSTLPSMAINFPPVASCSACVHWKQPGGKTLSAPTGSALVERYRATGCHLAV